MQAYRVDPLLNRYKFFNIVRNDAICNKKIWYQIDVELCMLRIKFLIILIISLFIYRQKEFDYYWFQYYTLWCSSRSRRDFALIYYNLLLTKSIALNDPYVLSIPRTFPEIYVNRSGEIGIGMINYRNL